MPKQDFNSSQEQYSNRLDGSMPDWQLMSSTGKLFGRKKTIKSVKNGGVRTMNTFARQEEELIARMEKAHEQIDKQPKEEAEPIGVDQINFGENEDATLQRGSDDDEDNRVQEIEEDQHPSYLNA